MGCPIWPWLWTPGSSSIPLGILVFLTWFQLQGCLVSSQSSRFRIRRITWRRSLRLSGRRTWRWWWRQRGILSVPEDRSGAATSRGTMSIIVSSFLMTIFVLLRKSEWLIIPKYSSLLINTLLFLYILLKLYIKQGILFSCSSWSWWWKFVKLYFFIIFLTSKIGNPLAFKNIFLLKVWKSIKNYLTDWKKWVNLKCLKESL